MPNKRSQNKVSLGVYVERELRDLVKESLEEKGISLTEYLLACFYKLLKKDEDEIIKKIKESDKRRKENRENSKSS